MVFEWGGHWDEAKLQRRAERQMVEQVPKCIRVLLVGDQSLILEALACLLSQESDIRVVGRGTSQGDVMNLVETTSSDVLLHDSGSSDATALDFLQFAKQEGLPVPVIVVSPFSSRYVVHQALVTGARGYVLKRASSRDLVHAIRSVHAGGVYLDGAIDGMPVEALWPLGLGEMPAGAIQIRVLAPREEEVLRLIALGFTAKEIADKLGINPRSVETHKRRASAKLGVRSRAKIVEYGMMKGWFRHFGH